MSEGAPIRPLSVGAAAAARGAVEALEHLLAQPESRPAFEALRAAARVLTHRVAESRTGFRTALGCLTQAGPAAHGVRTATLALGIGQQLALSLAYLEKLCLGALCHDLGEALVPSDLLAKAGELSEAEWHLLRQHPRVGVDLLSLHGPLAPVTRDAILTHHERLDGSGYPFGLEGEDVPLAGRIVGLVDCYEGLTRDRPDRAGLRSYEAVEAIAAHAAQGFDRDLFRELVVLLARSASEWAATSPA